MKKTTLILIAFLVAGFASNSQTTATTKADNNPNAPEITFDKLVHDYGTVQKGADGNCEFTFTNTGKEPLILTNVKTS